MTISVAIATYNEEANIQRCLKAVSDWVNDIVIYDGQSSDNTVKVARTFKKVQIISGPNHQIFHINKQAAIDACKSDWILQLDADEVVTPQLATEIQQIIQNTPHNGFWLKRKNYFLGTFLTKGGTYPDSTLRLYRRGKGALPCHDVHEQAIVDGSTSSLQNDLLHYDSPTFSRFIFRNDHYSSILATQITNPNFVSYFFLKPCLTFFSIFLRHRGYIDGFPGFVFAFYSALRFPSAYVKYWENHYAKNRH